MVATNGIQPMNADAMADNHVTVKAIIIIFPPLREITVSAINLINPATLIPVTIINIPIKKNMVSHSTFSNICCGFSPLIKSRTTAPLIAIIANSI